MSNASHDTATTVDLFLGVGGTSVWSRQQLIIDELDRLEATDAIDRYRVQMWGGRAPLAGPLSDTRFHRAAVRKVREFEEWADFQPTSVRLPFDREDVVSEFTGDRYRLVRLPRICLAVYRGGKLTGVYPCVEDGDSCTVGDFLGEFGIVESDGERIEGLAGIGSPTNR